MIERGQRGSDKGKRGKTALLTACKLNLHVTGTLAGASDENGGEKEATENVQRPRSLRERSLN